MIPKDWSSARLGEVVDFENGKGHEQLIDDTGDYIVVNSKFVSTEGKVFKRCRTCISPLHPKDICMVMSDIPNGKALAKCFLIEEPNRYTLNQRICALRAHDMDPYFLLYVLNRNRYFLEFDNGVGQTNLRKEEVLDCPVLRPPLCEQKKIAELLGRWDKAIFLIEKLIDERTSFHLGLARRLLTGEIRLSRFGTKGVAVSSGKEMPDNWARVPLHSVFERITRKNNNACDLALTISGRDGLVRQEEYFKKRVASSELAGYYLLKRGEFAFNRSTMNGYPYGAIKRLDRYPEGVVSTLYLCFGLTQTDCSSDYYRHYFEAGLFNREIYTIAQEGARSHGLLNIGTDDFFQLRILRPPEEEQRAIAEVLDTSAAVIAKYRDFLEQLTVQKRGLMQQLLTGRIRVKV